LMTDLNMIYRAGKLYTNHDIREIQERFNTAGPIARLCFLPDPANMDAWYQAQDTQIQQVISLEFLEKLVNETQSLSMGEASSMLFLARRAERDNMRSRIIQPITPGIAYRLRAKLWNAKHKQLCDMLLRFSRTPGGIFGLLFEAHFQRVFSRNIQLEAMPMIRTADKRSRWHARFSDYSGHPELQKALKSAPDTQKLSLTIKPSRLIEYDSTGPLEHRELVYYVPWSNNQVAIDSFIVHDGDLYLFQFAGGSSHDINQGLEKFLLRLSPPISPLKQHFIFVVPDHLKSFSCQHSREGFLQNHAPYVAKVSVEPMADELRMDSSQPQVARVFGDGSKDYMT
ncbi:12296_t:CDS:2, partial [Acaulospora colombiana]